MINQAITCAYCKSDKLVKYGHNINQKQRWKCKNCKKIFVQNQYKILKIEKTNMVGNQSFEKRVSVITQYVKSVSFKNPDAPVSLSMSEGKPSTNIAVDVNATGLDKNVFEVVLTIKATAEREGKNVFTCEVSYAGVFNLLNVPENEIRPVLSIFCPTLLFPYIRQIISDLTRDGGFPQLLIDPIEFGNLYRQ